MFRLKSKRIEKLIFKIYKKVFKNVKNEVFDPNEIQLNKEIYIEKYSNSKQYDIFTEKLSKILSKLSLNHQKTKWKEYYEKARKNTSLKLPSYFQFEKEVEKEIFNRNFKFIKSIPKNVLDLNKLKYVETLRNQIVNGVGSRKSFENLLKDLESKYAKIIARSESARLQTAILEIRAKKLDCESYVWYSANDRRTRQSHKDMKNVIVPWYIEEKKKPNLDAMYGHAGEFPNCRCSPEPIFDDYDLPNGNEQKIYDYKTKKIIRITRKKAKELLFGDKGE